jgi:hypothetical protein
MNAKKPADSRKWVALQLTLLSLASSGFGAIPSSAKTAYPGVFIADTDNRWHLPGSSKASGEQMGYVICDGGYLGSPLIPNEKSIVDQFLSGCKSGRRVGPGQLPTIDTDANYNDDASGYQAYQVSLNGKEHYLCHGFLNSTDWCSFEAEKQATNLANKIRSGEKIQVAQNAQEDEEPEDDLEEAPKEQAKPTQQRQLAAEPPTQKQIKHSTVLSRPAAPAQNQAQAGPQVDEEIYRSEMVEESQTHSATQNDPRVTEEAAREIAEMKRSSINYSVKTQAGIPQGKRAIEVTKQEIEALHRGETTIEQLAQGRQQVDLEAAKARAAGASAQIMPLEASASLAQAPAGAQAIEVTAEELKALQSGAVSMQELMVRKQIISLNNTNLPTAPNSAQVIPLNTATNQAQAVNGQVPLNVAELITQAKMSYGVQPQAPAGIDLQNLLAQAKAVPLSAGAAFPQPVAPASGSVASQAVLQALNSAQIVSMSGAGIPQAMPPSAQPVSLQPMQMVAQATMTPEVLATVIANANGQTPAMLPLSFQPVQAQPMQAQQPVYVQQNIPPTGFVNAQVPIMTGITGMGALPLQTVQLQAVPVAPQYGQTMLTTFENQPYAPAPYDMSQIGMGNGYTMSGYGGGVPATQAVTTIYGSHTNTRYWPGMGPGISW